MHVPIELIRPLIGIPGPYNLTKLNKKHKLRQFLCTKMGGDDEEYQKTDTLFVIISLGRGTVNWGIMV